MKFQTQNHGFMRRIILPNGDSLSLGIVVDEQQRQTQALTVENVTAVGELMVLSNKTSCKFIVRRI